jgi:DNA-binding NtrC family response regulator
MTLSAGSALVVDRASMVAEVVAMALEDAGYQAHAAVSYREASRTFRSLPDLGLLVAHTDLPDEPRGGALLYMAAMSRPGLPIVVISARRSSELPALPPTAVLLMKPFDRAQLMQAVAEAKALVTR